MADLQVLAAKTVLTEQDKQEQERLYAESRRLIETGRPLEITGGAATRLAAPVTLVVGLCFGTLKYL